MSRIFGPIRQSGYVVKSLDEELKHWTTVLGIGPFFKIERMPLDWFRYRGAKSDVQLAVALGFSGSLQIELIQQLNDAPSPYRDFVERNGYGLHHVSSWSTRYDDHLKSIGSAGIQVAAEGKVQGGPRFSYFATETTGGTMMEMADFSPEFASRAASMQRLADEWDGRNPVRPYAELVESK